MIRVKCNTKAKMMMTMMIMVMTRINQITASLLKQARKTLTLKKTINSLNP